MPELSERQSLPVEQIFLRDRVTPKDIRAIYQSINRDGKLNALKPYLEAPSDERLSKFSALFTDYVYRDAYEPGGALSLVREWSAPGALAGLEAWAKRRLQSPHYSDAARTVLALGAMPEFASLLKSDVGFLDPEWTKLAVNVIDGAGTYREKESWTLPPPTPTSALLDDLQGWLNDSASRSAWIQLAPQLYRSGLGARILEAFHSLAEESGSLAFEGLGYGIARLATTHPPEGDKPAAETQIETLLRFTKAMEKPSQGLFLDVEAKLKRAPDAINGIVLSERIKSIVPSAVSSFVSETLSKSLEERRKADPEEKQAFDKSFWQSLARKEENTVPPNLTTLFTAVNSAIQLVTGQSRRDEDADAMLVNLPIFTNALAITKWLEHVATEPDNQAAWAKLPDEGFTDKVWETPVKVSAFSLSLIKPVRAGVPGISPQVAEEVKTLGLDEFAQSMLIFSKKGGIGKFSYQFAEQADRIPLKKALDIAIAKCDKVRPFADTTGFPVSFGTAMGRKIGKLETGNVPLIDFAHRFLATLSPDAWHSMFQWFFEDLGLAKKTSDLHKQILSLFDSPEQKARAEILLDTVPTVYDLDQTVKTLPAPFVAYQRVLAATPASEMRSIGSLMTFAYDSGFFAATADKVRYPGLRSLVTAGRPLARTTHALGLIDPESREDLLAPFAGIWTTRHGGLGMDGHLKIVETTLRNHRVGTESILSEIRDSDGAWLETLNQIPPAPRKFLMHFIAQNGHSTLLEFLQENGNVSSALGLIREVRKLSANGSFADGLKLLTFFKDERMVELAKTLLAWEKSGELNRFLSTLEALLAPLNAQ